MAPTPGKARQKFLIDEVVSYFSPIAGFKRAQARMALELIRKYEANDAGRRTGGWTGATGASVNAEIGPALNRVRERCRDLVRNNPWATRAVTGIASNMIGTGILMQPTSIDNEARAKELGKVWKDWSESTDCDADGLFDYHGLQNLVCKTVVESGEALIVRKWRKPREYDIPIPMQLQVLEGDYIDTTKQEMLNNGGFILQGVEFNAQGRRVAYWLWNQHPGEVMLSTKNRLQSSRVPAENVRHVFRPERAGQVRGISWGAPCVIRLRDLDEYEDAMTVRMKIAACFSAFVGDIETPLDSASKTAALSDKLEPGAIEILPPGKTITFPNMPTASDDGHSMRMMRSIAMGFGVSYEFLTGDLSNVNFSSARMGWIEMQRNIDQWRWLMFIPRFCQPTWKWFLDGATIAGFKTDGVSATYTPPARQMIDPTKEVAASRDAVRMGLQSLSETIREQGRVPAEVFEEIRKDADTLDKLKLKLDSDPRFVVLGGTIVSDQQPTGDPNAQANG